MSRQEIGDNLSIRVVAETFESFQLAMRVAFNFSYGAEAYILDKEKGMIFLWCVPENRNDQEIIPLPYKMNCEQATKFAWDWLKSLKDDFDSFGKGNMCELVSDFGDVDNEEGFEVYNEDWGYINNNPYAFVAIRPAWICLGK